MRLRPFGRLDHVLVGAATWILAFLLGMFVTWSGIILCFAHNPSVRATERLWLFLARVRAAFFAASDLSPALRRRAVDRACSESASFETGARLSRLSALMVARARLGDVDFLEADDPITYSLLALRSVSSETVPFFGGGSLTPARRALDSP